LINEIKEIKNENSIKLKENENDIQTLVNKISKNDFEIKNLKNKIQNLNNSNDELQQDKNILIENEESQTKKIEKLKTDHEKLKSKYKSEIDELNKLINDLSLDNNSLTLNSIKIEKEYKNLLFEHEKIKIELNNSNLEKINMKKDLVETKESFQNQLDSCFDTIQSLKSKFEIEKSNLLKNIDTLCNENNVIKNLNEIYLLKINGKDSQIKIIDYELNLKKNSENNNSIFSTFYKNIFN
jgi:chromosome segregation ATPase